MSGHHLSAEERKDLNRLLRVLWQKLVQIVVQSRMGMKTNTISNNTGKGFATFNLEVEDNDSVMQELKKFSSTRSLLTEKPYSIEVLLRTSEGEEMVLEVWTLSFVETDVISPARIYPTIFDRMTVSRMTVLLKSAISVSRITPAYKFSFRQDSLKIFYKLYDGEPQYEGLGKGFVPTKIGQINTPISHLSLSLAYRTDFTIPSSQRCTQDQIMVKSDHFTVDLSPKNCRRDDKANDSSENNAASDESQDAITRIFTTSPVNRYSMRSRTNSESSSKSAAVEQKIFLPFVEQKEPAAEDYFLPEFPLEDLLLSAAFDNVEEEKKDAKEENCDVTSTLKNASSTVSDKSAMNNSGQSIKSTTSSSVREDLDYVVVDLKTPFGSSDPSECDLKTFYRECQAAPDLQFDSLVHPIKIDNLSEQLKSFEANMEDYDDLVKSLHSDSLEGSEVG